ncbi:unnamed protein product [Amoebophrya sp. A120]|nr:unnamed protein product [Amoebophrya sp. A120]|eukprot:GSA120T00014617001.1
MQLQIRSQFFCRKQVFFRGESVYSLQFWNNTKRNVANHLSTSGDYDYQSVTDFISYFLWHLLLKFKLLSGTLRTIHCKTKTGDIDIRERRKRDQDGLFLGP